MAIIIKIPTGICVGLVMGKKEMKEERHVTFLYFPKVSIQFVSSVKTT